jgi:hypothetical protein
MKKTFARLLGILLLATSAAFIPTQSANAFFGGWAPWDWGGPGWGNGWGNPWGWGGYPYGGYPYYGGWGAPYGAYPYGGGWGLPYYGGYPYVLTAPTAKASD